MNINDKRTTFLLILLLLFAVSCSGNKDHEIGTQPDNVDVNLANPTRLTDASSEKYPILIPPGKDDSCEFYYSNSNLYHNRLNFFGKQLRAFQTKYGRYPDTLEEYLDAETTIFWPIDPFTNKPFVYSKSITPDLGSMGKFSFENVKDRNNEIGLKILCSIPTDEETFMLANYPLPAPGNNFDNINMRYENQFSTLPDYLNSQAYLLAADYAYQFGELPETFGEFLCGYLIIKDNWPDMSSIKSKEDKGYFELGLTPDKLTYYSIIHMTTGWKRERSYTYESTPNQKRKMSQNLAMALTMPDVSKLSHMVPFASSLIYPTAESLPKELCITKTEILALK